MTGPGLTVETFAWILFAAAALAFFTGQGKLALGLGLPALCLAGAAWLSPAPTGVGEPGPEGVPAALPPLFPTFAAMFAAGLGLWAAHARWRRASTGGRATEVPYPDLTFGRALPDDETLHWFAEPLGRWDGRQWDGLCARLAEVTRDFLGYVVPKPGQPPKIDIHDPDVEWVIDGLLGAADLVVGASGDDEPQILAAAIREVERRWLMIRNRRDRPYRA